MKPDQKGLSITGYAAITVFMIFLAVLSAGCATKGNGLRSMSAVSRYFDKDMDTVWDAVMQTLEGIRIKKSEREKGVIVTDWVKGWSGTKSMGLFLEGKWQQRFRLIIKMSEEQGKTYVSVNAMIEEKPPGGSAAYRWNRTPSDGTFEQDFLNRLEKILGNH